jgi:small subunit ribosomal protein S21
LPEIILSDSDRVEYALKTFKRQMQKAGILQELRRRRHYVKPSEARIMKTKAARRNRAKAEKRARNNMRNP